MLTTCPACVERVLPRSDGTCPACRASMRGPAPERSRMTLREGKRYPPVCVTCGAATTRSSMVERVASKRKWPLAALGAFGIAMGLATLLPGRAMPVGPSGYAIVFLIVGGLALLRRGLMPGVSIQVRVPHCPGCKLPEVDTIDAHEGSITMVVHDAFRHETR